MFNGKWLQGFLLIGKFKFVKLYGLTQLPRLAMVYKGAKFCELDQKRQISFFTKFSLGALDYWQRITQYIFL